ncbi:MAG: alpha/beta hydrolase [Candidatus Kerfeldbacteria bacterium]|nr:alpha/beta hydrolase [Candidatus Kerfeldbacteria bacterium]
MIKKILGILAALLALFVVMIGGSIGFAAVQLEADLGHRFEWEAGTVPVPLIPYEERTITTADGVRLATWSIPVAEPKAVVILLHGFEAFGGKAEMIPLAELLYDAGYSTFLIDFRANGESEGKEVTLGVKEWQDAETAYDMVAAMPENQNVPIGFLGDSMGAVTAIIAAGHTGKGDFVIANVPFANYRRLLAYQANVQGFGWLPGVGTFMRVAAYSSLGREYPEFNPDQLITNIHVPIFIGWSEDDEVIGPNQGDVLFERANEPKVSFESGVGHLVLEKDWGRFSNAVLDFLDQYAKK